MDLGDINASLTASAKGAGFESLNQLSERTGIRKATLIEHRRKCLGLVITAGVLAPPVAVPVREEDIQLVAPAPPPLALPGTPTPKSPTNEGSTAGPPGHRPPEATAAPTAPQPPRAPHPSGPDDAHTVGERVGYLANLIAVGNWQDRHSVVGLARQWACSEEDVERLHRYAAARVAKNRGSLAAQLEASVASVRKMRDAERDDAARYMQEAVRAFKDNHFTTAKHARKLAAMARAQQLSCQKHLDALTIMKPQALTIQIGPSVDPEFQRAWSTVRTILDALYPGASIAVEDGLAAWEDGRLDEWLAAEAGIGSGRTRVVDTTGESVERAA